MALLKQMKVERKTFLKSKLLRQLALSITAFIVLIEGILLVASYRSRRVEFQELNAYAKERVFQTLGRPSPEILTEENINQRLRRFTLNIIGLTLIIICVVVIGTLIVFYYVAGHHILLLDQINKRTSKDRVVYFPKSQIPNNELGDLILSRDQLVKELHDYQRVLLNDSMMDGLTGLYNKTYFYKILVNTIDISLKENRIFTLVVCDIDYFKRINDKFGHPVGDQVLRVVSTKLKECARDEDICGRVGGEEFAIVLKASTLVGAKQYFERVSKQLEAFPVKVDNETIPVTLSMGTLTFEPLTGVEGDAEKIATTLFSKGDEALYYSKQNGRNRITHCELMQKPVLKAVAT